MATSDLPLGSSGESGSWVGMTKHHYYNYSTRCQAQRCRLPTPQSIRGFFPAFSGCRIIHQILQSLPTHKFARPRFWYCQCQEIKNRRAIDVKFGWNSKFLKLVALIPLQILCNVIFRKKRLG